MNLSEALDAALPEIPKARYARSRPPKLDPNLIVREDIAHGETVFGIFQRGRGNYYRLSVYQWQMAQLFDGVRSYEEIATQLTENSGVSTTGNEVQMFSDSLALSDFWYQTSQEKNLAMSEKLVAQRSRRANRKSKVNLAHISFSGWDPDRYLHWLDGKIGRFIYSPWCVLCVILLFIFEGSVFIAKWNVIGPDIPLYFNFTQKTFYDVAEFWVLLFFLGFVHESAHGLTCRHYGGEVHSMGLLFLYLTPCFFVDVSETWVSATRLQRLATIIAGIWIELVLCGLSMIVWTNTPPGMWIHDFTYKIILITGIAVVVMNLNPLLKLDGYYFLTEAIDLPQLKEDSTAFVSGWVQRHILRFDVEVPVIARRHTVLYVAYAVTSGAYSYLMLFTVVRLVYNISAHWLAEFALIPAGLLAFGLFRSRLRTLRDSLLRAWTTRAAGFRLRPWHPLAIAAIVTLFFVPLWRDRENAWFVIEPENSATVHAAMPGRVDSVLVTEGQRVRRGQPLLRMSSRDATAMRQAAQADSSSARFRAFDAQLRGDSIGTAAAGQQAALQSSGLARSAEAALVVTAPVDGVVLTRDPSAIRDQDVGSGEPLLILARQGPLVARIYIPVSALDRIPSRAEAALALPGYFSILRVSLGAITPETGTLPAGLIASQKYKGVVLPTFYSSRVVLSADAQHLRLGIGGYAKIFGARRSLFQRAVTVIANLVRAHVW